MSRYAALVYAQACTAWAFAIAVGLAYLSRVTYEEFFLRMKPGERRATKGASAAA